MFFHRAHNLALLIKALQCQSRDLRVVVLILSKTVKCIEHYQYSLGSIKKYILLWSDMPTTCLENRVPRISFLLKRGALCQFV